MIINIISLNNVVIQASVTTQDAFYTGLKKKRVNSWQNCINVDLFLFGSSVVFCDKC